VCPNIFLFFCKLLPEILRRLNQIMAKLSSIDDRLCKIEENQNSTQKSKEISVLQEFVILPLKTNEEVNNMERDLENQDFFEQMVNIFFNIHINFKICNHILVLQNRETYVYTFLIVIFTIIFNKIIIQIIIFIGNFIE